MPIQITSTTSLKHTVVGGVLEEWKALVQRESQTAYRLTGVEADHIALLSSPVVSVSVGLTGTGEQHVIIDRACSLALWRENFVAWCYQIIDKW